MDFTTGFFYLFAAVLLFAAFRVITARNTVHAALYLMLAFSQAAALWLLLKAEFLGLTLVLVYLGAVMVLFLFVVMMLDVNIERMREGFTRHAPLGVIVALIVVVELYYVLWVKRLGIDVTGGVAPLPEGYSNTQAVGAVLYTEYVYPFQLAAVVLLIAIVAAIALTMRRRPGLKTQDVSRQVAVRREDRVRLVKVAPEGDE